MEEEATAGKVEVGMRGVGIIEVGGGGWRYRWWYKEGRKEEMGDAPAFQGRSSGVDAQPALHELIFGEWEVLEIRARGIFQGRNMLQYAPPLTDNVATGQHARDGQQAHDKAGDDDDESAENDSNASGRTSGGTENDSIRKEAAVELLDLEPRIKKAAAQLLDLELNQENRRPKDIYDAQNRRAKYIYDAI